MLKPIEDDADGRRPRQIERSAVQMPAILAMTGAPPIEIRIHNLSTRGFMAECATIGLIGRYVWIEMPGTAPVNARIMWGVAGRIGGQFIQPIEDAGCHALRAAHPAA